MLNHAHRGGAERGLRQTERIRLREATRLRPNDWSSIEIEVLDISSLGLRGECEVRLMRTCFLSIDIPGIGPTDAEVRWQDCGEFGAEFARPIDLSRCTWTADEPEALTAQMLELRDEWSEQELKLRRQIGTDFPIRSLS